jgi:hypothetical protein
MDTLLLLAPILIGLAFGGFTIWLERRTRYAGLTSAVMAAALLGIGTYLLFTQPRWSAALMIAQGVGALYMYRWQRATQRKVRPSGAEA